jgi:hypothetical protein
MLRAAIARGGHPSTVRGGGDGGDGIERALVHGASFEAVPGPDREPAARA